MLKDLGLMKKKKTYSVKLDGVPINMNKQVVKNVNG